MRPSRMFAVGVTALTMGLAATISAIPAQAASTVHYVALGDSYSAGTGAGSNSGSCERSPNAHPALWAAANSPASFTFVACNGATTSDIINSQLSSLDSSTTLVSVTAGGNDAGFSSVLETCVLSSTSTCESAVAAAQQYVNTVLPGNLDTMLADIRAHAPNAKIIVLDYPVFYDLSVWLCLGLSSTDHQVIDNGINDMDGVIQTAAVKNGDTFADVRAQFSGHELCDDAGWLNSVTIPIGNSYHPTATGQKDGYFPVLSAAAASVGQ